MADETVAVVGTVGAGGEGGEKKRDRRPRGPRRSSGGGRGGGRGGGANATGGDGQEGAAVKRERPQSAPVPPELVGQSGVEGKIFDIVRQGRGNFGFINLHQPDAAAAAAADGQPRSRAEIPRIYFNFRDYEGPFVPRRGYLVSFTVTQDDAGRPYASEVRLTPKGLEEATKRDEEIKAKVAAEGGERKDGRSRPRMVQVENRMVTLKVTCQDKDGEREITVNVADSIGKMKHAATVAFDAPIEYSVYCGVSPETPEGTMLSRAHLNDLKDGDYIHLKPSPAKVEA